MAKVAIVSHCVSRWIPVKTLTAKEAKYGFGRLIDLARAEPVTISKHGRPVVVVMAVEEYDRIAGHAPPKGRRAEGIANADG